MRAFERVRLRKAWSALEEIGLTSEKLALSAERLGRARDALDEAADAFRHALVELHDGIYASFSRNGLRLVPKEVRVRVLASLLQAFGGSGGVARLAQIEALESALDSGDDSGADARRLPVSRGAAKQCASFGSRLGAICPRSSFGSPAGRHLGPAFRGEPRRGGDGPRGRDEGIRSSFVLSAVPPMQP